MTIEKKDELIIYENMYSWVRINWEKTYKKH